MRGLLLSNGKKYLQQSLFAAENFLEGLPMFWRHVLRREDADAIGTGFERRLHGFTDFRRQESGIFGVDDVLLVAPVFADEDAADERDISTLHALHSSLVTRPTHPAGSM